MIDGIWWLVILIAISVGLWGFAKTRAPRHADNRDVKSKTNSLPTNDALYKTAELIKKYFPDYQVTRKAHHLLISKQSKKIAMITIDRKLAASQRRLGDIPVINYHQTPSRAQLDAKLQEVE